MAILTLDLVVVAALCLLAVKHYLSRSRVGRLPPGPQGWPLVGNITDIPSSHEWITFAKWGDKWGDIISVTLLGQPMIILNSAKHAVALLEKKSATYSDRPTLMMGGTIVGWDQTLALTPYGERFREYRRLLFQFIGSGRLVAKYFPLQEKETHRFLQRVMNEPEHLSQHIRKMAGSIILMMSHGYEVHEGEDSIIETVDSATEEFALSTAPGAFLVDVFPALRYVPGWMPGAGWKIKATAWKRSINAMADVPHEFTKRQMAAGTAIPNFTSMHMNADMNPEREHNLKWSAASLYSGGADTTVSAVYTFFLAMTLYPEVQRKAQQEIDSVVGDALPAFEDRGRLPYINALVLEVLRWNPVAPLGVAHRVIEDDIHEGHFIPKGSVIIANIWKFLHDPHTYSNPMEFNPDRFIPSDGREAEQDPREYTFGFGRRICPGIHLADSSVFIACAMSLAAFKISKAVENGVVVEPHVEYTTGTISHPKPFKCSIKPRSATAASLILSSGSM